MVLSEVIMRIIATTNVMKYIVTIFILSFMSFQAMGQCNLIAKAIKSAEKYYDEGDLLKAAAELNAILEQNLGECKVEKVRAQILLTEVNLFSNQDSSAEESFKKALGIQPLYKVDTTLKSIDLFYFSRNYRTVPLFTLRPYVSINNLPLDNLDYFRTPTDADRYSTGNNRDSANIRTPRGAFTYGAHFSWHPSNLIEIGTGVAFSNRDINIVKRLGPNIKTAFLEENQNWLTIPVLAKIKLGHQRHIPKLIIGGQYGFLLSATMTEQTNNNINSSPINIGDLRHKHHYFYSLGLGYDVRPTNALKHYISFELRYDNQRTAIVNTENRYQNPETLFGLGYVDDDVPIGTGYVELSIGISFTKYKVQRIKLK